MNPARELSVQYDLSESIITPVLDSFGGDVRKTQKQLDDWKQPSHPPPVDEDLIMRKILEDSKREAEEKERKQREEDELINRAIALSKKETEERERSSELQKKQSELKKKKDELMSFQAFLEEEKKREYAKIEKEFEAKMAREDEERQKKWKREQEELETQRRKFLEERTKAEERMREEEKRMQEDEQRRKEEEFARKRKEDEALERHRLLEEKERLLKEKEEQIIQEMQMQQQAKEPENVAPLQDEDRPPVVAIYCNPEKAGPDVETCRNLLMAAGVSGQDIKEMDFRNDFELQSWVSEKCGGKIVFPVIFIRGEVIAGVEALNKIIQDGKLSTYLDGSMSASRIGIDDPAALQLGILDKCLSGGEILLSGVSQVLWLPVTILTWPFQSKGKEAPKDFVDIPVVHCNWYWRHLERTFRFTDTEFYRVHPRHNDVRAAHKYSTVDMITVESPQNIIIRYKDGSSPDYLRSTQTNISNIVKIIAEKSPDIRVQKS